MKRLAVALLAAGALMTATGAASAKDLTPTGIEEAFVDAVGTCGPSSSIAGALGKSDDPAVKIALRDALIVEAADDAANVPGAGKAHSDCLRKELTTRGLSEYEISALPSCVKSGWPDAFDSLGNCVRNRGRLEGAMTKKSQ